MKSFKQHITEAKKSPIVDTFHYSNAKFNKFDSSYLHGGTDQKGPGLYTSNEHESHYGSNIHHMKIDTTHFIKPGMKVKKNIIKDMIENSPHLEDAVSDWHENPKVGKKMLIDACSKAPDMHEAMERVWYDGYRKDNHAFLQNAGMHYHGTIVKPNKFRPSVTHYVVWHEKAIKSISHEHPGHGDELI